MNNLCFCLQFTFIFEKLLAAKSMSVWHNQHAASPKKTIKQKKKKIIVNQYQVLGCINLFSRIQAF